MTSIRTLSVCFLGLLTTSAAAQGSKNATLLARLTTNGGANDVWGYTDPKTGKEYAIVGTQNGTHFYDCSNPRQPVQRAYIAAPRSSSWRDMKTFGGYAYIVSEGHGGMQIVDLTNPDAPKLVKLWGSSLWGNTHNIAMDTQRGHAYCCGTRNGMHIIDVKTDPTNPTRIATYGSPYIHDLHIQDGFAHLADIYGNNYRIIDVSKLPAMPELGSARAPGTRYCHNTWVSRDNQICLTSNEAAKGPVAVWDISNMRRPTLIAQYRANFANAPDAIPHNAFIRDRVGHISHYTEGYRSIDLTDPKNPVEVAFYDTYTGASRSYNGNWGVYPFNDSGVMYVTDRQNGFFVLKSDSAVVRYGDATPPKNGSAPKIYGFGAPYLGNQRFKLQLEDAPASKSGVLLVGGGRGAAQIAGLKINVSLTGATAILNVGTDANGRTDVKMPIPLNNSLVGGMINAQFFVAHPSGPLGLTATRGIEFKIIKI